MGTEPQRTPRTPRGDTQFRESLDVGHPPFAVADITETRLADFGRVGAVDGSHDPHRHRPPHRGLTGTELSRSALGAIKDAQPRQRRDVGAMHAADIGEGISGGGTLHGSTVHASTLGSGRGGQAGSDQHGHHHSRDHPQSSLPRRSATDPVECSQLVLLPRPYCNRTRRPPPVAVRDPDPTHARGPGAGTRGGPGHKPEPPRGWWHWGLRRAPSRPVDQPAPLRRARRR